MISWENHRAIRIEIIRKKHIIPLYNHSSENFALREVLIYVKLSTRGNHELKKKQKKKNINIKMKK